MAETDISEPAVITAQAAQILAQAETYLRQTASFYQIREIEEGMQKVMDSYAGGITTHYEYNGQQLALAQQKITQLQALIEQAAAADMHELMSLYEVRERLLICQCVIAHLAARKETRWHSFAENLDHPQVDPHFNKYVNSVYRAGKVQIIFRDLVKRRQRYEHQN